MTILLGLLTRALITVLFALTALVMTDSSSPTRPEVSSTSASGSSVRRPFWSWLISALSGTLEIEAETEQLRSENARLAELDSGIESLFCKYGISSRGVTPPEQR